MARSPTVLDPVRDLVRNKLAELVASFYVVALGMIAVVVAIPIFVLTALGFVALTTALSAEGTLAAVLSIAWFIAFLGGTTFVVARIVHWVRPVTQKVESLGEPVWVAAGQVASVQNFTSPDPRRAEPPADVKGDPLIAAEVRRWRVGSSHPEPTHPSSKATPRGTGRLLISGTVALLFVLALYLTVTGFAGADPSDPGLYDVAYFFSPLLAGAAGLVIGLLLVILAGLRLIELTIPRALGALLLGLVGGPIAYLVLFVVAGLGLGSLFEDGVLPVGVLAVLTFLLPVASGIGVAAAAASQLTRGGFRIAVGGPATSEDGNWSRPRNDPHRP